MFLWQLLFFLIGIFINDFEITYFMPSTTERGARGGQIPYFRGVNSVAYADVYVLLEEGDFPRLVRTQVEIVPAGMLPFKYELRRVLVGDGDLREIPFGFNDRKHQVFRSGTLYFREEDLLDKLPSEIRFAIKRRS